jgi:predicted secreted protein
MNITGGLVLFAVIWFMVLFMVLPWRLTTQGEAGKVEPGTPESAPTDPQMGRRIKLVTAISVVAWLVIAGVILSGWIGIEDLDFFGRM